MNERIKQLRISLKESQTSFASKIKISRSALSKIESGENNPSEQTIILICKEFNIMENWLRYGKEPMRMPKANTLETYLAEISSGNDEFIIDIIMAYMELDDVSKKAISTLSKSMLERLKEREG